MSASSEILAESLRELDLKIANCESVGDDTVELKAQRQQLLEQLARANKALNEGSSNILKG